jgi:hypothetical protein
LGYSLVIQHLPSMCKAVLMSSKTKTKTKKKLTYSFLRSYFF